MADQMVKEGQLWLNNTYGNVAGFNRIPEKNIGSTNWITMYALTRALQIELGITALSDAFGPTTLSRLQSKFGTIGNSNAPSNVIKIIQTALYCKGYFAGSINGSYSISTAEAIMAMRSNMGLSSQGNVTPKVFKALLTMDAYVLLSYYGGREKVRLIQQYFNSKYGHRSDYYYMPCDGVYSRDTQKALMFAIQYEGGMADGVANGHFGPGTQNIIKSNAIGVGTSSIFVYLFKSAMIFNGFDCNLSSSFTSADSSILKEFQSFYMLSVTGAGNFETWASLLISTGDPNRKGKACDCVTEITDARAKALKAAGYQTVGRYLTNVEGTSLNKKIQDGELNVIFKNGLSIFPIYQTWGGERTYFNYGQGVTDAQRAVAAARKFGFNNGTVIYFAVDYDALGEDITSNIIPHFRGIINSINNLGGNYSVGIYGPRNVCIQASEVLPIKTSFVSSMSTGFSGNLGFPLPYNWAFDQISTISIGSGASKIEIDNNIKSNRDKGQTSVKSASTATTPDVRLNSTYKTSLIDDCLVHLNNVMTLVQKGKAIRLSKDAALGVYDNDARVTSICQKYNIRKALLQSVYLWEYAVEGLDDIASDSAVKASHAFRLNPLLPEPKELIYDCSTGPCQIFAWVAIDAINYAISKGLYSGTKYNKENNDHLYTVWNKLQNINFCIEICALVLLHAASMVGVSVSKNDNYTFTTAENKKIISRYNGIGDEAKAYGERNYKTYTVFEKYNKLSRE